jgi:ketosteroid isomerase-like protein
MTAQTTTADATAEILSLEEGLQNALMTADAKWFEANWTADAIYVHMSGGVDNREEFIERLRSKATVYKSRQTRDVKIRQYGDAAVITGASLIDIIVKGTRKELDTRFTRVYIRTGDRWLLASNQSGANTAPPKS